jgi:hypothetical protein
MAVIVIIITAIRTVNLKFIFFIIFIITSYTILHFSLFFVRWTMQRYVEVATLQKKWDILQRFVMNGRNSESKETSLLGLCRVVTDKDDSQWTKQ